MHGFELLKMLCLLILLCSLNTDPKASLRNDILKNIQIEISFLARFHHTETLAYRSVS